MFAEGEVNLFLAAAVSIAASIAGLAVGQIIFAVGKLDSFVKFLRKVLRVH